MEKIGLFGGSFNPPHTAHMRAAIEVREALRLDAVEFIPSARPPHKAGAPMLPFAMRARLLELAIQGREGLRLNLLEGKRPGPSYTCDTLAEYGRRRLRRALYFIMGAGDLFNLPVWRRGFELGTLANLAVMSREGEEFPEIAAFIGRYAAELGAGAFDEEKGVWPLASGLVITYLPIPRLDISASDIRQRWLQGRSVGFLTPEAVERELFANKEAVAAAWGASD